MWNGYDKVSCISKLSEAADILVDALEFCSADKHIRTEIDLEIMVITGIISEVLKSKGDVE